MKIFSTFCSSFLLCTLCHTTYAGQVESLATQILHDHITAPIENVSNFLDTTVEGMGGMQNPYLPVIGDTANKENINEYYDIKTDGTNDEEKCTTPLCQLCRYKKPKIVKYFVEHCGANVNPESAYESPLYLACSVDDEETAEYLLAKGAYHYFKNGPYAMTALQISCAKKHWNIVKLFFEYPNSLYLDFKTTDKRNRTALHYLCASGLKDADTYIKKVIQSKSGKGSINYCDITSQTALHIFLENRLDFNDSAFTIVKLFVANKSTLSWSDKNFQTPLDIAYNQLNVQEKILKRKTTDHKNPLGNFKKEEIYSDCKKNVPVIKKIISYLKQKGACRYKDMYGEWF